MPTSGSRVVIVTGASRGLGREIARSFGGCRDRLVINYREREEDARTAAQAVGEAGGEAVLFRADVRSADEVEAMVTGTLERWGRIDVLVNNAALTGDGLCLRMSEEAWDRVLGTNLTGPFHCIRAAARAMSARGGGHIINLSSIVGMQGREGQSNYASSKAGLVGLTKAAARELGRFNIRVNAVLPGFLPTEMGGEIADGVRERILRENALGRISDPREVAGFIVHLASMNNVSGQVFNLDSRTL